MKMSIQMICWSHAMWKIYSGDLQFNGAKITNETSITVLIVHCIDCSYIFHESERTEMLSSWLSWVLCVCQASLVLKWASCLPPVQRSPQRRQRHWCVWPARASRQTGAWAGRWTGAAGLREQRWAPGEGRSVQLEQQPDSLWAGVDGERLSELWGHTERSACAHWTRDETAVFRVDLLLFSLMSHMETNSTWATPSFSTSSFSRSHLQMLCFVCFIWDYMCALSFILWWFY